MGVVVLRLLTLSLFLTAASVGHAQQTQQFDLRYAAKERADLERRLDFSQDVGRTERLRSAFRLPAGGSENLSCGPQGSLNLLRRTVDAPYMH